MPDHLTFVEQVRSHDFRLRVICERVHIILKTNLIGTVGTIGFGLIAADRAAIEN